MLDKAIRVRFAPSPTGILHLGSARTALVNWLFAKKYGGTFVLRIEDTDIERSDALFEKIISDDLNWLGLEPDESAQKGGPKAPYRQSERQEIYTRHAKKLLDSGKAYHCFCTIEELEEMKRFALSRGKMPKYDGSCRFLSQSERQCKIDAGLHSTVRFAVNPGKIAFKDLIKGDLLFDANVIGDFIIVRSTGRASFNFAVVVDDMEMDISHVIRGEDHLTNTARHCLLFDALGVARPEFAHHSLIFGPDGTKLSKRHGAVSITEYREKGYLAEAMLDYLALLTFAPSGEEKLSTDELVAEFEIDRVSSSPAIFDIDKLNWLNGLYIRDMTAGALADAIKPYIGALAFRDKEWLLKMAEAIRSSLVTLSDSGERSALLALPEVKYDEEALKTLGKETSLLALKILVDILEGKADISLDMAKHILVDYRTRCAGEGISAGAALKPVRYALTGAGSGPELFYIMAILGGGEAQRRIRKAMKAVSV